MRERPLSPHLSVYRFMYTMALSIAHRITGVALSISSLLLVYWLVAVASGPGPYAQAVQVLSHPFATAIFMLASFCFFYHLSNGIRHLFWDLGHGFELKVARASGWTVAIVAVLLTVVTWVLIKQGIAYGSVE